MSDHYSAGTERPPRIHYTASNFSAQSPAPESPWMQMRRERGYQLMVEQMIRNRAHNTSKSAPIKLWTHEEFQRDWVIAHVGQFFLAYRDDTLISFWSSLEKRFLEKFPLCFEAREKGIILARYLAQTIHEHLQDKELVARRNISADEAATEIFAHLPNEQMS
ncbi:hypothetical protein C8J56DRAFT_900764 [Mycena floridula]|nr:hypothetical protein C8J56DRAFT_900764 [Mycena floridula]